MFHRSRASIIAGRDARLPPHLRRLGFVLVALAAAAAPVALAAQERRPMTTDDVLDMVGVGQVLLAPDGSWVLFGRSDLDWDENERKTTWWKVPASGGAAYRFIGEEGASNVAFSPRGTYLSFTRTVDGKAQLFLMRTDGGEAIRLTDHATSVRAYRWTDDEGTIVFTADEALPEEVEKERKKGADAIVVDEGPNGQRAGRWRNLWAFDVETRTERRLTEGERIVGSFDVSPAGDRVAFTARSENRRNQRNLSEIYLLEVGTGEIRRLTENRAPESRITFAPDGRRIAYEAPSDGEWELRLDRIWVMDTETGARRPVSDAFSGNIGTFVWSADGSEILFGGLQRTDYNLYTLDVETGRVTQRTHVTGALRPASFSRDRSRMAYTFEDFTTPRDVWVAPTDGSAGTRLTDLNPRVRTELALGRHEVVRWRSADGLEIEGILVLPPDADAGSPHPFLLHIHGGPAGVFTNSFSGRYHVWAGLGYAQLLPNVRGSSGYTDELLRGNMYDIGGGDYQDLMTGVDAMIRRGVADPERLALRGWSYGGILGGWTITQTDRFKAASLGAMVSDWTSEYGPGFNHDVRLWYIGGTPWENPERWRERSPLTHVARVTTPTLLLHGMNDTTDTEAQSMMFFQALKDQGKTVRYIRFPREPHGFREPRHQRTRDVEEIRWIQEYTRGIDWTPWERVAGTKGTEGGSGDQPPHNQ